MATLVGCCQVGDNEGVNRDATWLYDRFVAHDIYALLAKDWKQLHPNLFIQD
jgi:hypothetical protein